MNPQKASNWANIGSFLVALYMVFHPQTYIPAAFVISPALGLVLIVLLIAAYLHFAAVRMTYILQPKKESSEIQSPPKKLSSQEKVKRLGEELFAFLREIGPDPSNTNSQAKTQDDIWNLLSGAKTPYSERLRNGYVAKFGNRIIDTFREIRAEDIDSREIEGIEIDPPEAVRSGDVRKIAEELFLIAARIDIKKASRGN